MRYLGQPRHLGNPLGYGSRGGDAFATFVESLNLDLWYRHRETAGTTATNSANPGSNDGTMTNIAIAKAGQFGPNQAVTYNGDTSIMTLADTEAILDADPTHKAAFLINAIDDGEGNTGQFYGWGNAALLGGTFKATDTIECRIDCVGTDARFLAANNILAGYMGAYVWYFFDYAHSGNRKCRIHIGDLATRTVFNVTTLGAAQVDTASVGDVVVPAADMNIGNRGGGALDRAQNADIDEALFGTGSIWADAEMQNLVNLTP